MRTLIITATVILATSAKEPVKAIKATRDPNVKKNVGVTAPLNDDDLLLGYETVARIASLPLHCHSVEYPNKLSQVLPDESELLPPSG